MKKEKETKENKKERGKINIELDIKSFALGLITFCVIGLITGGIVLLLNNNATGEVNNIANNTKLESLKESEITEVKEKLSSTVKGLKENNAYIQLITGENTFDTFIYNKKGEVFVQGSNSSYIAVFKDNGEVVRFADSISVDVDIDILSLIENTINAEDIDWYREIIESEEVTEVNNYNTYVADFDSWEDIRKMYEPTSKELADIMVENFEAASGEEPTFRMRYIVDDNGGFTVACYIIMDGTEYVNWYVDGYLNVYDWELPEKWYSHEFDNEELEEESTQLLESLVGIIDEMLTKFSEDNGDIFGVSTEEVVEEETESTEVIEEETE